MPYPDPRNPAAKEEPEHASEDSIPQDDKTDNEWQMEPLKSGDKP